MKCTITFILIALTGYAAWAPMCPAQEEEGKTFEDAKALYEEIKSLQVKQEAYRDELETLSEEFKNADTERKQEIESQGMLKQRAFERMTGTIKEKSAQLFEISNALIAHDPKNAELRIMRFMGAYDQKEWELVLEDGAYIPEDEHDLDFWMIQGECLEKFYRFEEAIECYEKAIELMPEDQRSYTQDRLAYCYFNTHRFEDSRHLYELLATNAPERQKQHFHQITMTAGQHVKLWEKERVLREEERAKNDNPLVVMELSKGRVKLELFEDEAPNTVANFITLVEKGFYDGTVFHRVVPQFMVQGGDPEGTGEGGPGYKIKDECRQMNARRHFVGSLSMANSGPDTAGSQFFFTTVVAWWLDGRHTVFGRILEGQDVVNRTEQGDRIVAAEVVRKRDHEYKVEKL